MVQSYVPDYVAASKVSAAAIHRARWELLARMARSGNELGSPWWEAALALGELAGRVDELAGAPVGPNAEPLYVSEELARTRLLRTYELLQELAGICPGSVRGLLDDAVRQVFSAWLAAGGGAP